MTLLSQGKGRPDEPIERSGRRRGPRPCNGYISFLYAPDVVRRVDLLQTDIRVAAVCATLT
jgi:hypothetical protein